MSNRLFRWLIIQLAVFGLVGCSSLTGISRPLSFMSDSSVPGEKARAALSRSTLSWNLNTVPVVSESLEPTISPVQNEHVDRFIWHFSQRDSLFIRKSLKRRELHYEAISKIFSDYSLPIEIINLGIVESGFNRHARSRVGAKGIWQLMRSTARVYGLKVNNKIDEREDPIRSSVAAARHLRDLYARYQDWNLVLAAYNAGPGGVNRAIAKAGTRDYWKLVAGNFLTRETREFVPKFMAVSLILRDPARYGLELET